MRLLGKFARNLAIVCLFMGAVVGTLIGGVILVALWISHPLLAIPVTLIVLALLKTWLDI
jgi:hypothetical protein